MRIILLIAIILGSATAEAGEYTAAQKEGCHTIMAKANEMMDRIETVRGGIPYNFYIDRAIWANETSQQKNELIIALSTCKHVIYGESVIHIKDSRTGKELGKMDAFGPVIYK